MTSYAMIDRLLWASLGGFVAIALALGICRITRLHPAVKTWACRIAFLKMILSLLVVFDVTVETGAQVGGWVTPILAVFLLEIWAIGALFVGYHGVRAYWYAARLGRVAQAQDVRGNYSGIRVRQLPELPEPCVVGVIRPTLLVPPGFELDSPVIRHELAHVSHLDAQFGVLGWICYGLFWFVPGLGRLVFEHSLWQEVWADLAARKEMSLPAKAQADALLDAVARTAALPAAVLGFRGDARALARRIEAMFIGRYSKVLALVALFAVVATSIPLRASERQVFSPVRRLAAPVAEIVQ